MTFNVKVLTSKQGNAIIIDAGDGYMTTVNPATIVKGVPTVQRVVQLKGAGAGQRMLIAFSGDDSFNTQRVMTDMDYPFSKLDALVIEYRPSSGMHVVHLFGQLKDELHHLKMPMRYIESPHVNDAITFWPAKNYQVVTHGEKAEVLIDEAGRDTKHVRIVGQFDPVYGDQLWSAVS